jgi:hypothetical protein
VTITQDPSADEDGIDATTTPIGVYCVAFKGE